VTYDAWLHRGLKARLYELLSIPLESLL